MWKKFMTLAMVLALGSMLHMGCEEQQDYGEDLGQQVEDTTEEVT